MSKVYLSLIWFISLSGFAQFQIGHVATTFTDPARSNRTIPVEIYYPADTGGNDAAIASAGGQFPLLCFGHGFVMGWDAYENLWTALVPKGYIMVFPKTEGGILPSHAAFAADLAFVIKRFNQLNDDNTSVFYQRVSAANAVMGHSMGGGAAVLAIDGNPEITALAVLAAAETNPSAINAASNVIIPAFIVAGANDCVAPPAANQLAVYDALASGCKTYISITGGSHCQMANSNFFCSFGESTCSPSAVITTAQQHAVLDSYLEKWLDATLKNDCAAGSAFDSQIVTDSNITYEKTCLQCPPLSVSAATIMAFSVGPNPFSNYVDISISTTDQMEFVLTNLLGEIVINEKITGRKRMDTSDLKQGIYLYSLMHSGQRLRSGKLIKQ